MRALLLVGHGSHLNADSSAPVYRHAAALRGTGAFDEVRECFWKEEPSLREALDLVSAEEVWVVPLFISEGYFTEEVIPRELGLSGPAPSLTLREGRVVRYCSPIGTHPWMTRMILRRAEEAAGLGAERARGAGLVVVGHGTERNATSAAAIHRVTEEARGAGVFGEVRAGFLDQDPAVGEVLAAMTAREVVLVPFFIAEGWHTQETIPDDLGLRRPSESRVTELDGRRVYYASPVGTFPEVAEIVLARTREAEATLPGPAAGGAAGSHAPRAQGADAAFRRWVEEGGAAGRRFLQVHVLALGAGRYRLRHVEDAAAAADNLEPHADPYDARTIAQTDAAGAHRPLKTAPDLRRGWSFESLDAVGLDTALGYLYPACVAHWHAAREGSLRATPWRETAERQSGIYASVALLPDDAVRAAVGACCADDLCLRRVAWPLHPGERGPRGGDGPVPCPEACSLFVSLARTALALERGEGRGGDGTRGAPRQGDFDHPDNPRRLRYLAARAPDREPADHRHPPTRMSLVLARWELRPHDGSAAIRGDLRAPMGPPPETAVVICHGASASREEGLLPGLAREIAGHGHAVLTFDAPDPARAILAVLEAVAGSRLFPHPPRRVGLLGLGSGASAATAAAEAPRAHALVTWHSPGDPPPPPPSPALPRLERTLPTTPGEAREATALTLDWLDRHLREQPGEGRRAAVL